MEDQTTKEKRNPEDKNSYEEITNQFSLEISCFFIHWFGHLFSPVTCGFLRHSLDNYLSLGTSLPSHVSQRHYRTLPVSGGKRIKKDKGNLWINPFPHR